MSHHLALPHHVTSMNTGAAAIAVFLAILVTWYLVKWIRAELDETSAKASHQKAKRAARAARVFVVGAALLGALGLDLWFRGQGRK
jgi:hypothetical protein